MRSASRVVSADRNIVQVKGLAAKKAIAVGKRGREGATQLALLREPLRQQRQRDQLDAAMIERRAAHLVEHGPDTFPLDEAADVAALTTIDRDIAALPQAITLQGLKVDAAQREVDDAHHELSIAVLALVNHQQEAALAKVQAIIASAADALADLMASDQVVGHLLGASYGIPRGSQAPLSGSRIVASLMTGLPARLRPEELTSGALASAAAVKCTAFLSAITQEK